MTTAADWSGRVGEVWAEEWASTERSFAGLEPLLEASILAVAPERGRFLDIGCGVGSTSLAVAWGRPVAAITGVDLSPGMIDVAQGRVAATSNAVFVRADALAFAAAHGPFDLLFSRHGVMFFPDPVAAFALLRAAAAPGAPIVFSCFAAMAENPWATLLADGPPPPEGYAPGPFAFAAENAGRDLLRAAGWRDPRAEHVNYVYEAGQGDDPVADALAFFRRIGPAARALRDADPTDRPALIERLTQRLAARRAGDGVNFPAAAWIWTATA